MNRNYYVQLNQYNRSEALASNIPFSMVVLDDCKMTVERVNGRLRFNKIYKYKPYATFDGEQMFYFKD